MVTPSRRVARNAMALCSVPVSHFYSGAGTRAEKTAERGVRTDLVRRCRRTKNKKRHGNNGGGVRHAVRKPKSKRSLERSLRLALAIVENSPLNDYLATASSPSVRDEDPVTSRTELVYEPDTETIEQLNEPLPKKKLHLRGQDQYSIDAGQIRFGATECKECGAIYQVGHYQDETDHLVYHQALDVLTFKGWKSEKCCGRWNQGRIIVVSPGDPVIHWNRIYNLLDRVVHPELGYTVDLNSKKTYKVYLYVENKIIIGCLVAEPLQEAHKLLTLNNISHISTETYRVKCGISRIWTHKSHRNKGIATKLMNAMRANFIYGYILTFDDIAFSSPTHLGKIFAEKYLNSSNLLAYVL